MAGCTGTELVNIPEQTNKQTNKRPYGLKHTQFHYYKEIQLVLRKSDLLADIRSTILPCDQPFFTEDPTAWESYLPHDWTAEDQPPLGMLQLLGAASTPLWAASPEVSKQLAEVQMAYQTFLGMPESHTLPPPSALPCKMQGT